MIYTYTVDLPYQDPVENKRVFTKLPRSILLPPYLAINPYFVDYTNAIDEVFDSWVESKIDAYNNLRNMWVTTRGSESKISQNLMLEFTDWGGPERATVIQQVNLLGMQLSEAGIVGESSYRAIAKFLGQYWFEKGKSTAIDFLNFCLNLNFTLTRMWTQDYVNFITEGSAIIGNTIYDTPPGPWFPTTHVQLSVQGTLNEVNPYTLNSFFYDVANYNLVLEMIVGIFDSIIASRDNQSQARIVMIATELVSVFNLKSDIYYFYKAKTSSTSGDPGSTFLLWNNSSQVSATQLNISNINANSVDIHLFLSELVATEQLVIRGSADIDQQVWNITGAPVNNTTYWSIPVSLVSSSGIGTSGFANNAALTLSTNAIASSPISTRVIDGSVVDYNSLN